MTSHYTAPGEPGATNHLRVSTSFGTFDVDEAHVLTFPLGVPGFEDCRRFVLIASSAIAPLQCLQAVGDSRPSFVAIDPRRVLADYSCPLGEADDELLGRPDGVPLVWLALVSLDTAGAATVNLRAPVVINPRTMLGCQVVAAENPYPLRHALARPAVS
ncbi:MAG: hypothetical protein EHM24_27700 [Acidobacteria bacterium]|nr:MAG: hypothetical protein EHM24_27700 [Acidobacteriota bacterium]